MILNNYIIQTKNEAGQWIARFSKKTGHDQRDGDFFTLLGIGMDECEEDAIYNAIQKALYTNA